MKSRLLIIGLLLPGIALSTNNDTKLSKRSKNSLKEEIGTELKATLDECAAISEKLATAQLEISRVQKRLLTKGEELLDNGPSFKQKTHKELTEALKTMSETRKTLAGLDNIIEPEPIKESLRRVESDACLGAKKSS